MKSMVGQLNDSSRDVECHRTWYSRRASASCVLVYCSTGDGCGQKWNDKSKWGEQFRSKGKNARSLGTKSRHVGRTSGDVFPSVSVVWQDGSGDAEVEVSVDTPTELSAMFAVCRCGMSKRQQWCRGGTNVAERWWY